MYGHPINARLVQCSVLVERKRLITDLPHTGVMQHIFDPAIVVN